MTQIYPSTPDPRPPQDQPAATSPDPIPGFSNLGITDSHTPTDAHTPQTPSPPAEAALSYHPPTPSSPAETAPSYHPPQPPAMTYYIPVYTDPRRPAPPPSPRLRPQDQPDATDYYAQFVLPPLLNVTPYTTPPTLPSIYAFESPYSDHGYPTYRPPNMYAAYNAQVQYHAPHSRYPSKSCCHLAPHGHTCSGPVPVECKGWDALGVVAEAGEGVDEDKKEGEGKKKKRDFDEMTQE